MNGRQHITYKKRLRRSSLSPMARHVAATISDLHYEQDLDGEPVALTLAEIARETGMARATAIRYLDESIAAGWTGRRKVRTANRNQPSEYLPTIPAADRPSPRRRGRPMTDADKARLTSKVESPDRQTLNPTLRVQPSESQPDTQSDHGRDDEYVVLKKSVVSAAPPPGAAAFHDEQATPREPTEPDGPVGAAAVKAAIAALRFADPDRDANPDEHLIANDPAARAHRERANANPLLVDCPTCPATFGRRCNFTGGAHHERRALARGELVTA